MAKKQSSFWKIVLSGAIAFVLVGGGIASMSLVQQDSNNQSNAWGGSMLRFRAPYFTPPRDGSVPMMTRTPQATPNANTVCWNRVVVSGTQYYWANACKGMPGNNMCAQVVTQLTTDEIVAYSAWLQAGKPSIPGCDVYPAMTPRTYPVPTGNPGDVKQTMPPRTAYPGAVAPTSNPRGVYMTQ